MVGTATLPPELHGDTGESATEELIFRVCGSSRDGQIVRLKTRKCSIGSGRQSTLRLRARGVAPLHCLIIRGRQRTVVRRWSSDTRLNGRAFSDAELTPGDRLSIGPIDLELLPPGLETDATVDHLAGSLCDALTSDTPSGQAADARPAIDRHLARLKQANRQARQRARRLVKQLRDVNREVTRLQEQVKVAPCEATSGQPSAADSEAAQQRTVRADEVSDRDAQERQQWLEEQATREDELRREELHASSLRAEMNAQRDAWETKCREWGTQREQSQRQLTEQAEQLKQRQEELAAREQGLEEDLTQREQAQQQLTEQAEQLKQRQEELATREQDLQQRFDRTDDGSPLGEEETTSPMARFQMSSQQQPVSQLEIVQGDVAPDDLDAPWDEDDSDMFGGGEIPLEDVSEQRTDEQPVEEDHAFEPALSSPSVEEELEQTLDEDEDDDEDEEESINDYMMRLMQRVQGPVRGPEPLVANERKPERTKVKQPSASLETAMPAPSQPSDGPARDRQPEPSSKRPDQASKTEESVPESVPATPDEPVEMSPRTVAPERRVGLSAMRELANLSAQNAIDHHAKRQIKIGQRGRLGMAVLAAVTGAVLLTMHRLHGVGIFAMYIALFSFAAAGFWGACWIMTAAKQWFGSNGTPDKIPDPDEATAEDVSAGDQ